MSMLPVLAAGAGLKPYKSFIHWMLMKVSTHIGCWNSRTIMRCKTISIYFIFPQDSVFWSFKWLWSSIFSLKSKNKIMLKSPIHSFWSITLSSTIFSLLKNTLWLHNFKITLCSKPNSKINLLHLIVAPQLSGGRQHNYSTKTRQAGPVNKQSMQGSLTEGKAQYSWPPHSASLFC